MSVQTQTNTSEPPEVPILRERLTSLDKAMRDLVATMSDDPASGGWNPKTTPPGYLFTCDFLLNTITDYLEHIKAIPIVQGDPIMVERYNDVITRNVLTYSIVSDKGEKGATGALRRMRMDTKSLDGEPVFEFSSEIQEKARVLMEKNQDMPKYGEERANIL